MTDYDALASLSAVELRDAIAAGTYTARQVTEYYLSQINQHADLYACMCVHADASSQRADELDASYQSTDVVWSVNGLPSAFKDTVDVARMVTTYGSKFYADSAPTTQHDHVSM